MHKYAYALANTETVEEKKEIIIWWKQVSTVSCMKNVLNFNNHLKVFVFANKKYCMILSLLSNSLGRPFYFLLKGDNNLNAGLQTRNDWEETRLLPLENNTEVKWYTWHLLIVGISPIVPWSVISLQVCDCIYYCLCGGLCRDHQRSVTAATITVTITRTSVRVCLKAHSLYLMWELLSPGLSFRVQVHFL